MKGTIVLFCFLAFSGYTSRKLKKVSAARLSTEDTDSKFGNTDLVLMKWWINGSIWCCLDVQTQHVSLTSKRQQQGELRLSLKSGKFLVTGAKSLSDTSSLRTWSPSFFLVAPLPFILHPIPPSLPTRPPTQSDTFFPRLLPVRLLLPHRACV